MEDEERGGLESEDKSGTILDEDDIGNISPEDISVDEEPGITPPDDISISADEIGCSAPEDSGSDERGSSIADEFGVSPSKSDAKADEER